MDGQRPHDLHDEIIAEDRPSALIYFVGGAVEMAPVAPSLVHHAGRTWIETRQPNSLRQLRSRRNPSMCISTANAARHAFFLARKGNNLAEVTVWVHVIIGQGNPLTYSK
jgi:hypothetical protein